MAPLTEKERKKINKSGIGELNMFYFSNTDYRKGSGLQSQLAAAFTSLRGGTFPAGAAGLPRSV